MSNYLVNRGKIMNFSSFDNQTKRAENSLRSSRIFTRSAAILRQIFKEIVLKRQADTSQQGGVEARP